MSNDGTGLREWAEHTEALREIAAYYASWDRPQAHKVAALTAALTAMQAAPVAWQPIETAPKDNKRLLYLARFSDEGLQGLDYDGIWQSESESREQPQVYSYWASANGIEEPTHWAYQDAALPPPPTGEWHERFEQ